MPLSGRPGLLLNRPRCAQTDLAKVMMRAASFCGIALVKVTARLHRSYEVQLC
jgi:hypothetical protein